MDQLQSLSEVLRTADSRLRAGESAAARVWPTGLPLLDTYLGGGLRSGELTLLGGAQGLGKTTMALQIARNVAMAGERVVFFSYEHDATTMLERLIALEAGTRFGVEGASLRRIREAMEAGGERGGTLEQRLATTIGGAEAVRETNNYAERLLIHRSTGSTTSMKVIESVLGEVSSDGKGPALVVIDYLQKVHVPDGSAHEEERVTSIVEGIKDLALDAEVPILAVVAASKDGLGAGRRLRVHELRGSSALAYEADVVLIMNDKYEVVARHHLVYDIGNAERFRDWMVLSIEKNRSGLDRIDLEFRKRLEQGRFEADGRPVEEQLIDERIFVE